MGVHLFDSQGLDPAQLTAEKARLSMAEDSQKELEEYLQVALEIARKAGKVAKEVAYLDKNVQTKSSTADLVTETDKKVEDLIISELKHHFPMHCFIGEECTADGGKYPELTDEPTWIIDPIDGTTNFVHRFPFSAVSIGLVINKIPVVGVVYNFVLDQMFAARKGGGASMNGTPIHVSDCTESTKALLLVDTGSSKLEKLLRSKFDITYELAKEPNPVHGFRCVGSAAIAMCMVASGNADGYYENDLHCWDIAGADVIVREAGGVTMFPTGESLDIMRRGILCAGTQELAQKLVPHTRQLQFPS